MPHINVYVILLCSVVSDKLVLKEHESARWLAPD